MGGYQWMKREGAQKGGGLTVVLRVLEKERKRKRRRKKRLSLPAFLAPGVVFAKR